MLTEAEQYVTGFFFSPNPQNDSLVLLPGQELGKLIPTFSKISDIIQDRFLAKAFFPGQENHYIILDLETILSRGHS